MKFYMNYMVPIILTFGLCLTSLTADAAITNSENSQFTSAQGSSTFSQNVMPELNNLNASFTTDTNGRSFNNQANSFNGFTGRFNGQTTNLNFGSESVAFEKAEIIVSAVPETSNYALLASGLLMLFFIAKRRKTNLNFNVA
jgi:hypothetical protein